MGIATVITSGKGGVGKSTVGRGAGKEPWPSGAGASFWWIATPACAAWTRMTGAEENLVFDMADVVFARCSPAEAIYPCGRGRGAFLAACALFGRGFYPSRRDEKAGAPF